jgi:hypothetical protein
VKKRYRQAGSGALEIGFGCDPVGDVSELVVERGYGHGGSLAIWRLTPIGDDAGTYDLLAVAHDTFGVAKPERTIRIARGVVPVGELSSVLADVRPALSLRVRELEPPAVPGKSGVRRSFSSTGNFHHFIRLRDEQGHELSAGYTGYPGSSAQPRYVGVVIAMERLLPLLQRFKFERDTAGAELRTWFSAHAVDAWPRLEQSAAWWVRERIVRLAGNAGEPSVVPLIVSELERGLGEVRSASPDEADAMATRYLPDPLAALASVTGWDPRRAEDGTERPLAAAARHAVDECRAAIVAQPGTPES